jgi:hypothetical protein
MSIKKQEQSAIRKRETKSPNPSAKGTPDTVLIEGLTAVLGYYLRSQQGTLPGGEYDTVIRELGISRRNAQRCIAVAKAVERCDGVSPLLQKALNAVRSLPETLSVQRENIRGGKLASPPGVDPAVLDGECGGEDEIALDRNVQAAPNALITYTKGVQKKLERRRPPADRERFLARIRNDDDGNLIAYRLERMKRRPGSKDT